ncbi:MAG: endolytic transglycosylase MltG [Actinobacteria bacterium]|nr:endolytic transglycosylase MltG [Actinomycetota bacterium]
MTLTKRGRLLTALGIVVVVIVAVALGGFLYLRSIGVNATSAPGKKVEIVIPSGATSRSIGDLLEKNGVIESALGFRVAAYLEGGAENIQAGRYEIATGLSATDALAALLEEGPIVEFVTVTFPEGSWLTDFARILENETHISGDAFLKVATSGQIESKYRPPGVDTMEGLMFPSTYQIVDSDDARSVARRLAAEFEEQAESAGVSRIDSLGVTPYEAITIASMIEAEAQLDEERPMIARVIYNRIEEGMNLGIDATVQYAIGEHKEELTVSDLDVDSPYNTRKYPGIPPTPIGAPGRASLEAAVNPADGPWLYYVLNDCEGHHAFSESYDEFLANKEIYQSLEC